MASKAQKIEPTTQNTHSSHNNYPHGYLHGVEVIEAASNWQPIQTVDASTIGLIGTAPDADAEIFPINTLRLIGGASNAITTSTTRLSATNALSALGSRGTLPTALASIFTQAITQVVLIRVVEGESEADTINHFIGGIDSDTDHYTGVQAFLGSQSQLSTTPRLLIAPNFTHQRPNAEPNPVIKALLPIAEQLRAIIIADGCNTTDEAAINWRNDWNSARIFVIDPWVFPTSWMNFQRKVENNKIMGTSEKSQLASPEKKPLPPSPFVAGLMAKVDAEEGFWVSPSNHVIEGVSGLSRPVDFALGQTQSRANRLNEAAIATIIHEGGYRLWGNRTCSRDPQWAFLSVRRTADLLHASLIQAHLWAVDRNLTRTYASDVAERVNAYLARLKSRGAILAGECVPDAERNTPTLLGSGQVNFRLQFTPPYPAERICFWSQLSPPAANDTTTEKF